MMLVTLERKFSSLGNFLFARLRFSLPLWQEFSRLEASSTWQKGVQFHSVHTIAKEKYWRYLSFLLKTHISQSCMYSIFSWTTFILKTIFNWYYNSFFPIYSLLCLYYSLRRKMPKVQKMAWAICFFIRYVTHIKVTPPEKDRDDRGKSEHYPKNRYDIWEAKQQVSELWGDNVTCSEKITDFFFSFCQTLSCSHVLIYCVEM